MKHIENFPYPYYYYGSEDSTDEDVIIAIKADMMPQQQEARKRLLLKMKKDYNLNWNANLAVFEQGIMVDTIFTKSWIDSLNNALYATYHLHQHKQQYTLPVSRIVTRNKTLAIYKAVRTVMTMLSRSQYRTTVRPVLKGIHDFYLKLEALDQVDLCQIEYFNQKNTKDVDIWKIIAFYIVQNQALIVENQEIYTKKNAIIYAPDSEVFIYRKTLQEKHIRRLQQRFNEWIAAIRAFGLYTSKAGFLTCGGETIDMKNEKF